ncbi:hypothetical protein [Streptomyces triticisoli]|uniref:hypothetical protein n=1 Tax=Streptomyces triticisoli TaxID=2182797 RepID=UPI0013003BC2|nr:hypothetical protein [Streptomyces triticisoli]
MTGPGPGVLGEDVTPDTGEDIDAPPRQEAYANVPDLRREAYQVLALRAGRDGRRARTVTGPPVRRLRVVPQTDSRGALTRGRGVLPAESAYGLVSGPGHGWGR